MSVLIVNGHRHEVAVGGVLLSTLQGLGYAVPSLCHDARLKPIGGCRLCLVQIVGQKDLASACRTTVTDGLEVWTHTAELEEERRTVLGFLARQYPAAAVLSEPERPLHQLFHRYGVTVPQGQEACVTEAFVDTTHPYLVVDMQRCVLCFRCVHICRELQGRSVWHAVGRGANTRIVPAGLVSLLDSACNSCGACADTCPSGAIRDRSALDRPKVSHWTRTVCPYCGVGCELELGVSGEDGEGRVHAVRPVLDAPVNKGHLCVKGRYAFDFYAATDRITQPMLRLDGAWRTVSWDDAWTFVADAMTHIRARDGANSLAVLGSARATNEDNYVAQKFARVVLGTNSVDSCARVCHGPSAAALKMMLGAGCATNSYDDIERARLILLCGANASESHPVLGERIRQAVRQGAQLIVIDPRSTELAALATVHLAVRPGGNIPLLNAMAQVIVSEHLHAADFVAARVDGWDALVEHLRAWTPEAAAPLCGVEASLIRQAARLYALLSPAMSLHGLGMTEHVQGTEGVMALINLALLTGNIGMAGAGVNPLRGQNNVQGGAQMGCDPGILTGGVGVAEAADRFAQHWGVHLPTTPGLNLLQMMDAAAAGRLKGLWCIGYDILQSNAQQAATHQALAALELLIVQDLFMTETARAYAHVFLPAAGAFEKDGTFINAERRIQRVRQAVPAPGEARPDWQIIAAVAGRMGHAAAFPFASAEAVWDEVRRVWPGVAGMSYARLEAGGLQWPCPDATHPGTPILHQDGFGHGQRASLRCIDFHPSPEVCDAVFPFMLITGRTLYAFNVGNMTGRTPCVDLRPTDTLDVALEDARQLGVHDGQRVTLRSRYGATVLPVRICEAMRAGEVFATFHDPDSHINALTSPYRDRYVHTPEYKRTAVVIEP
jgi:formate dehydrogenase major subunit